MICWSLCVCATHIWPHMFQVSFGHDSRVLRGANRILGPVIFSHLAAIRASRVLLIVMCFNIYFPSSFFLDTRLNEPYLLPQFFSFNCYNEYWLFSAWAVVSKLEYHRSCRRSVQKDVYSDSSSFSDLSGDLYRRSMAAGSDPIPAQDTEDPCV